MPPTVTREMTITYAGLTVGGTDASNLLDGKYTLTHAYDKVTLGFSAVVIGSTAAAFTAAVTAFEAAFRKPDQDCVVTLGSETLHSFGHAANTGFSARPSATKSGGDADSGRSRRYTVTIEFGRPANLSGRAGRRDSTVTLEVDANGRRVLTIEGTYTALDALGARAQYDAQATTYCAAVATAVCPTANLALIRKVSKTDDQDKICDWTHYYEELMPGGESSGVEKMNCVISRDIEAPGDTFGVPDRAAKRLHTIRATISGQGPADPSAITTWTQTTRNWIIGRIRAYYAPGFLALISDTVEPDVKSGDISGTLIFLAATDAAPLIEYRRTVDIADDTGRAVVPVHDEEFSAYVFRGPRAVLRTTTEVERWFGDVRTVTLPAYRPISPDPSLIPAEGWCLIGRPAVSETPLEIGTGGYTFRVVERTTTTVERWIKQPTPGVIFTPDR